MEDYYEGILPKLWVYLVKLHAEHPELFNDPDTLKRQVATKWTQLTDPSKCPNCSASMTEYVHKLDFFNALLLKQMGDIVKRKVADGVPFTQANQIHVVSAPMHDCVRHRTTQTSNLGLIAKVKREDGTHDREKGWLITRRGFAALRGEPVPAEVTVFRNEITERTEKTTTLDEVFRNAATDQHGLIGERDPMQWVNFGEMHKGAMF